MKIQRPIPFLRIRFPLPFRPRAPAVFRLARHEQAIRHQPAAVFRLESVKGIGHAPRKAGIRSAQKREARTIEPSVIDAAPRVFPRAFLRSQQPVAAQNIQIDEIRIPRERGGRLVGRIAVRGGIERQDLPIVLPRIREKIDETVRFLAETADAVLPGQRKHGQQDPAALHPSTFHISRAYSAIVLSEEKYAECVALKSAFCANLSLSA